MGLFTTEKTERIPMENNGTTEEDSKPQQPKDTENLTHPELEYKELAQKLKEALKLPDPVPLTDTEIFAAWSMRVAIKTGVIKHELVQTAMHKASEWLAANALQDYSKDTPAPAMRQSTSHWGTYTAFALTSENLFNYSPEKLETHRLRSRFNVLVPIAQPKEETNRKEAIFSVLVDNPNAMAWQGSNNTTTHSFLLGVETPEDIVVINLKDKTWADIDIPDVKGKVVYIQDETPEEQSPVQEEKMKKLLDANKLVIREIHDPQNGVTLESINNHNWGDARPMELALCQIAEKLGGVGQFRDNKSVQKMLEAASERYNFGHNEVDAAIHTFVLEPEIVEQVDTLYKSYKEAIPTHDRIKELFGSVEGYGEKQIQETARILQKGLTKARLVQFLIHAAAGADGDSVRAGLLHFYPQIDRQLDHFSIEGNLEDIKQAIIDTQSKNLGKAREAVRVLTRLLDVYSDDKSNMNKIGFVLDHLPDWRSKLRMADATIESGAGKGNSGQIMTSYAYPESRPYEWRKTTEGTVNALPSNVQVVAISSSAAPDFVDTAFSVIARHKDPTSLDSDYDMLAISVKANWSQKKN